MKTVITFLLTAGLCFSQNARTLNRKSDCSALTDKKNCFQSLDASGNFAIGTTVLTNSEFDNETCVNAKTIDPTKGNRQKVTLTAAQACALTFTQPTGKTVSIQLKVIQSAAGTFNGTITGGLWPGGTVPTITATSGAVDILSCYLDGTATYCVATQDFR